MGACLWYSKICVRGRRWRVYRSGYRRCKNDKRPFSYCKTSRLNPNEHNVSVRCKICRENGIFAHRPAERNEPWRNKRNKRKHRLRAWNVCSRRALYVRFGTMLYVECYRLKKRKSRTLCTALPSSFQRKKWQKWLCAVAKGFKSCWTFRRAWGYYITKNRGQNEASWICQRICQRRKKGDKPHLHRQWRHSSSLCFFAKRIYWRLPYRKTWGRYVWHKAKGRCRFCQERAKGNQPHIR